MTKNELIIVTYNIELSINVKKIVENIFALAKEGVGVFCLQEIIDYPHQELIIHAILKKLGNEWKAEYHIGDERSKLSLGTSIIWNTNILQLETEKKTLLSKLKKIQLHEFVFAKLVGGTSVPLQRRATTCMFRFNDKTIRITSLHLDHVGGTNHRISQLQYFLSHLNKTTYEIICGDFNTFDLLQTGKEKKLLQQTLGKEFIDASENVGHTDDLYHLNFENSIPLFKWIIKTFHIHVRRKLDYIWVKHFRIIDCHKIAVGGSDHLPIMATLRIP